MSEAKRIAALYAAAQRYTGEAVLPAADRYYAWLMEDAEPDPAPTSGWPYQLAPSTPDAPRIFAHYFPPYPRSIDNKPASDDYYSRNYLNPDGEGGKHRAYGGLLRDRPAPRAPLPGDDWKVQDYRVEIEQAIAAGIDGFFVDVLSVTGLNWQRVTDLWKAAEGLPFVLVPQLDANASVGKLTPAQVADAIASLLGDPNTWRHRRGGQPVLSAFKGEGKPVAWWRDLLDRSGSVFMPVLLDSSRIREYAPISVGIGTWGTRNPGSTLAGPDHAATAHEHGIDWIAPVSVQDARPSSKCFWEARGWAQLAASWQRAIDDGADFVCLTTWNDYSESTQFAPSMAHGDAILIASGWWASIWRGQPPTVERDALLVAHRRHKADAKPVIGTQLQTIRNGERDPAQDLIDVLVFATAPCRITIRCGDKQEQLDIGAGMNVVAVPLGLGTVTATLERNGSTVVQAVSPVPVVPRPQVQDMQYWMARAVA